MPSRGSTPTASRPPTPQAVRASAGALYSDQLRLSRLEERLRKRWGLRHIEARVAQVAQIEAELSAWAQQVQAGRDALAQRLAMRLWMPPDLKAQALQRHDAALTQLAGWAHRLSAAREGFAQLPVDETVDASAGPAPAAVAWPSAA